LQACDNGVMRATFVVVILALFARVAHAENKTFRWHTIGGVSYQESKGVESCGKEVRDYVGGRLEHVKNVTLTMNMNNGEATIQVDTGDPIRVAEIEKIKDARLATAPLVSKEVARTVVLAIMLFMYENGDSQLAIMRTVTAAASRSATCADAYRVSLD